MNKTEMYKKLQSLTNQNLKADELKKALSQLAEETKPKTKPKGVITRTFVTAVPGITFTGKVPRQMKELYQILLDRETKSKKLQELHEELDADAKVRSRLDTVQLPRVIYRFYQKRLIDAGALKHEKREIKS